MDYKHPSATSAITKMQGILITVLIVLAGGIGGIVLFSSQPSKLDMAKREGGLLVYGNIEGDFAPIQKGFETKYPDLAGHITYKNMGPPDVPNKIIAETKVGNRTADMIFLAYANAQTLQQQGLLMQYKSSELANFKSDFYDKNGEWAGAILLPAGFVYNTQLVKKEELPTTLQGLADAKWKGKEEIHALSAGSLGTHYVASLREVIGQSRYDAFLNGLLKDSQPKANPNLFGVLTDIANGTKASIGGVAFLHDATKQKEQGKTIEFFNPSDIPLMTTISVVAIIKNTKSPYTAQVFEDYVLSTDGQTVIGNIQVRIPARTGVQAKYTLEKLAPNAQIKLFPSPEIASNTRQIADDFKSKGFA